MREHRGSRARPLTTKRFRYLRPSSKDSSVFASSCSSVRSHPVRLHSPGSPRIVLIRSIIIVFIVSITDTLVFVLLTLIGCITRYGFKRLPLLLFVFPLRMLCLQHSPLHTPDENRTLSLACYTAVTFRAMFYVSLCGGCGDWYWDQMPLENCKDVLLYDIILRKDRARKQSSWSSPARRTGADGT